MPRNPHWYRELPTYTHWSSSYYFLAGCLRLHNLFSKYVFLRWSNGQQARYDRIHGYSAALITQSNELIICANEKFPKGILDEIGLLSSIWTNDYDERVELDFLLINQPWQARALFFPCIARLQQQVALGLGILLFKLVSVATKFWSNSNHGYGVDQPQVVCGLESVHSTRENEKDSVKDATVACNLCGSSSTKLHL